MSTAQATRPRLISLGVLSEAVGVPASTIRHWESMGWLPTAMRVEGGGVDRRVYTVDEVEAVRMIAESRKRRKEDPVPA